MINSKMADSLVACLFIPQYRLSHQLSSNAAHERSAREGLHDECEYLLPSCRGGCSVGTINGDKHVCTTEDHENVNSVAYVTIHSASWSNSTGGTEFIPRYRGN
jgi:hypothetical protein